MVNTRSTGTGSSQQGQNNQSTGQQTPLPMPPPLTPEQFFQLQMQMMATLNNTVQALQQIHTQPPPPPPPQPRDRRADFLRGHPPTFSHTADPLQADDWLRSVERQLDVAQCDDKERVIFTAGQLRGSALDWWESYPARDRDAFTWVQFQERFRNHNIPAGVMKMKHKEFLALKQGSMTVTEYRDRFLQLARYAPAEVAYDGDKQERFWEGLDDHLEYALMNHRFDNFNQLVDAALNTERKRREIEDKKRKMAPAASGSNTRPRYQYQQQQQQHQRQIQQYQQRQQQYPPRPQQQQQQAGQDQTLPAPPARSAPPAPPAPRQGVPTPTAGQQAPAFPRACYHCGELGHYANVYPRKAQAGQQGRAAPPKAPSQGRVNHVTAESAAEAPNVVIGMFMVNTHPATVLFDTGATHSFITRSFVEHHGIHTSTLKRGMLVSSR
jgi:hypothetical protein